MKTSTCALDPIPSNLVKDCLLAISPLISTIINNSFSSGSVPQTLKFAAVTPILKKPGLNPDVMTTFPDISKLPCLSKILERAVATQLTTHLTAAFDTISHAILLSRLESRLNIAGTALSWLGSYLTNRPQFISINNCTSSTAPLSQGVPQGLVHGPQLFILHMLPLGDIIRRRGLHFHCYADDVQLYISTKSIINTTLSTLTNCLTELKAWMHSNLLILNCDKSDIITVGAKTPQTQ